MRLVFDAALPMAGPVQPVGKQSLCYTLFEGMHAVESRGVLEGYNVEGRSAEAGVTLRIGW